MSATRLDRLPAPAFWTRWAVLDQDGARMGTLEKKGSSSGWYAYGPDGGLVASSMSTRAMALSALERAT